MEFRVLGPVGAWLSDRQLPITAAKQRALLAMGLLSANRTVSTARLVDAVWPDEAPPSAANLIQTYVSVLRRILPAHVIVTRAPGYVFQVGPGQLDLHRFETLLAGARAAAADGRDDTAAAALREALALWHGPALDGLTSPVLRAEAARLDELRLVALEECAEAELRLDRADVLTPELARAVAAHPLRERLRGQLMRALYRCSRQAEALEVYRDGRALLDAELGIQPGPELQRLHVRMLAADPDLAGPAPPLAPAVASPPPAQPEPGPSRAVPAQLPRAVKDFTGRAGEFDRLRRALLAATTGDESVVCAVAGKAGSGKTALALHVAHALIPAFPDGQLFVTLHGAGPSARADPREVLGGFLRALGIDTGTLPESTAERSALYRSILAGRRVLVVIDDAGSEAQVRPLLPASPGCAALLTGRIALIGLEGGMQLVLSVLDVDQATDLLGRIAGADRVAVEPHAAREIVRLCGGLPLAVRAVGARLAARPRWPLAVLADRLRDERRRLDELATGDLEVRASVELSYRGLADGERLAFRRLGVLGLPDFSPWLLAPLAGVSPAEADRLADRLADAQLLDLGGVGPDRQVRYRIHDLIRLYAQERGVAEEPPEASREAVHRTTAWLLNLVDAASERAPGGTTRYRLRRAHEPVPDAGLAAELLTDPGAWIDAERGSLVAAVERASALGLHEVACDLAAALLWSFRIQNSFDEWWRTHDAALAAARTAGDRHSEAVLLLGLGHLRYEQDRLVESGTYYGRALGVCREVGDRHGEAAALIGLATIRRDQGHFAEAQHFLVQTTAICRDLGDVGGLAEAAYGLGYVHRETGRYAEALAALEDALGAYRAAGNRRGVGLTLRSIGLVHRATGALAYAAELFQQSIEVFTELGDALLEVYGVQVLAKVHIRQGNGVQAREPLERCLAVCTRFGDRFGAALVLRTLGELDLALGDADAAVRRLESARAAWVELGLALFRARTERDLAQAHARRGDHAAADAVRAAALETFGEFGSREYTELQGDCSETSAIERLRSQQLKLS